MNQNKLQRVERHIILNDKNINYLCFLSKTKYLGKKVMRGLFRSFRGKLINADVNGAYNILRKGFPNIFKNIDGIEGLGLIPLKVQLS